MTETPNYTPPVKPPLSADQKSQLQSIVAELMVDVDKWNQDILSDSGIPKPQHVAEF